MEGDFFGWWLVGANLSLEWGERIHGGRWERRLARPVCVRSRMVRSSRHSAGTLWLWTVAAPSSLPAGS